MDILLFLLLGVILMFLGCILLIRRIRLAKLMEVYFEQGKVEYDTKVAKASNLLKPLLFLVFKPRYYYHNEGNTKNILFLISLVLIILGFFLILLGLRVGS